MVYCIQMVELEKGGFLYRRGDDTASFYFVLKGKLEVLVDNALASSGTGETEYIAPEEETFKFSKGVDESEFFGMRQEGDSAHRNNYARAVSDKVEVLKINRELYDSIVKKT